MDPSVLILLIAGVGASIFALTRPVEAAEPVASAPSTAVPLGPAPAIIPGVDPAALAAGIQIVELVLQVDWADVGQSVQRSFDVLFNPGAVPTVQEQVTDKRAAWGEAVTDVVVNQLPNEVFDQFSDAEILTAILQHVGYPRAIGIIEAVRTFRDDPRRLFTMTEAEARDTAGRILGQDPTIGAFTQWARDLKSAFNSRRPAPAPSADPFARFRGFSF